MAKRISFKKESERQRISLEVDYTIRSKTYTCPHAHVTLDYNGRILQCDDCEEFIDPFDFLMEYQRKQRKTRRDIARWEAAKAEFNKIQAEWNLTIREKRRIKEAMDEARPIERDGE